MGIVDSIRSVLSVAPYALQERSEPLPPITEQILNIRAAASQTWRLPSITEALGVPAIQRAVSLIANTTGSLAVQGYRDGALMAEVPRVVARPNPFETPGESYRDIAYCLATRGEAVLWIAKRDGDELPAALILVPPRELEIEENTRNRLFPIYRWGKIEGTRYSPAHTEGAFVHITYLREPGELRGKGPLQMCGAATSVSVEAQAWAASFFSSGGHPSILIKTLGDHTEDEMQAFKEQWAESPPNWPRVVDDEIEDVKELGVNEQGAQMLEGRMHQNGEAARMFGIPGSLLEYSSPGSSLTYQNLEGEFTKFVRACLAPNYLEKIEQALSDLLPRSTVVRFNVKGFLRADIKTRFDVYQIGIEQGIITAEQAQIEEGYRPGDVEYAPVLPSPPQSVPTFLQARSLADLRCPKCDRVAGRVGGPAEIICKRCGTLAVA